MSSVVYNINLMEVIRTCNLADEGVIMTIPPIYTGTSGLLVPIPKRDFPPEFAGHSRLAYYAKLFNSLEINSSFYKLPLPKTVGKWAADVPENFKFTFKLWKGITHNKQLDFNPDDVTKFMRTINEADDRKGSLLVQFPPSLTISAMPRLVSLLATIGTDWPLAVEFRHRSWYNDEVYKILEEFNAALVIQDMPASTTPMISTADDLMYIRFHGPGGRYKDSYSDQFLAEYATYIHEWQAEGKTVYVYFNNTAGDALNNLFTLQQYLNNN
ncbi:DUF72 domain-containing protein [Mucilaginibacter sp. UR6-11]|uniref:DUF72 domain-containing protein n=1 Tax=Mucilaginibacter sp. UR6-11 TaxID=1435644 RepID=UPI001E4B16E6|nr:DUF72 domain-containing protein [Mucilaginibacter sp. UR6-11]MCC8426423.1 DUF72 domain-containing protein [Mucilaginibacter sp. UR6-11]